MKNLLVVLMLGMLMVSCATVKMPEDRHFIKASETETIESGKATVYFYRIGQFVGGAVKYHIRDGNDIIGALKSNSYFKYIAEPGEHFFWAENEKISSVNVDCKPDKKYFIEGDISMGAWMGNPELSLIPEKVAESRIHGLQYYTFDFSKSAPSVE